MAEIEKVIINGTEYDIGDGSVRESIDSLTLGIDPDDGKIYIYVDGEKQGDGIEVGSATTTYDVTVNAKGRTSASSSSASVDRGESVSISYTIPEGWNLSVSATMRGNAITVPSGNPMVFTNVTGNLVVNVNATQTYKSLSDLQTYFQTPVTNAMTYINGLGDGWAHYIITTDHHIGNQNELHSADIVSYLLGTGKFDKSIILGDFVDGGYVTDSAYLSGLSIGWHGHNNKTLFITGNHDTYLDRSVVVNDFMSGDDNVVIDATTKNWYYDNTTVGIRFIGFHYTQMDYTFLENAVSSLPSGYIYFIVNHIPMRSLQPSDTSWTMDDTGIQNVLVNHTDKMFGGFLIGHLHRDSCVQFEWKAWHTMFNCDKCTNAHGEDRQPGTAKEHAVTLMSVKKSTNTVKFYRIGSVLWGTLTDGEWTYTADTPSQWEYVYEPLHFPRSDGSEWNDGMPYLLGWEQGYRLGADTGIVESNSDWYISDFMYCSGANCIVVNQIGYIVRNWFYDANKNPLSTVPTRERPSGTNIYIITVPEGAVYFRTSQIKTGYQTYTATPYENEYTP